MYINRPVCLLLSLLPPHNIKSSSVSFSNRDEFTPLFFPNVQATPTAAPDPLYAVQGVLATGAAVTGASSSEVSAAAAPDPAVPVKSTAVDGLPACALSRPMLLLSGGILALSSLGHEFELCRGELEDLVLYFAGLLEKKCQRLILRVYTMLLSK
jgi:hypothetical protein